MKEILFATSLVPRPKGDGADNAARGRRTDCRT